MYILSCVLLGKLFKKSKTDSSATDPYAPVIKYYGSKANIRKEIIDVLEKSNLYTEMKGCYAGGEGTWLALRGGPYVGGDGNNLILPADFTIEVVTSDYITSKKSKFSAISKECYED